MIKLWWRGGDVADTEKNEVKKMDNQQHTGIVSFIWGIADECLRDVYVLGKYHDIILPMVVIMRLDAVL